jgi:hypothetical protein
MELSASARETLRMSIVAICINIELAPAIGSGVVSMFPPGFYVRSLIEIFLVLQLMEAHLPRFKANLFQWTLQSKWGPRRGVSELCIKSRHKDSAIQLLPR